MFDSATPDSYDDRNIEVIALRFIEKKRNVDKYQDIGYNDHTTHIQECTLWMKLFH